MIGQQQQITEELAPRPKSPGTVARRLVQFWAERKELDRLGAKLDEVLERVLEREGGRRLRDFLNGVWLGHPLHPVLTDLPIGFWVTSAFLDVATIGRKRPLATSTAAVAAGILTAVPTAAAGLMDWHTHLEGRARRVGIGHALTNSAALVLYSLSLLFRLGGGPGRFTSFLALGVASMSAYLGGHLVFYTRSGVRREPEVPQPSHEASVLSYDELQDGRPRRVRVDGFPIALVRRGVEVYAIGDVCPHLGCSLAKGVVEGDSVRCTCHGSRFSLHDGEVLEGPATSPVPAFDVSVVDGRIQLSARGEQLV